MPYINKELRKKYQPALEELPEIESKGELEYCIFYLMTVYMENKKINYSNLHDTAYAAIHCGDEFRRRFLDKREDSAIRENGDI